MINVKRNCVAFALAACLGASSAAYAENMPDYLEERAEDYPGCTEIVMRQMLTLPDTQRTVMMPHLFEACKAGRSIGEDRTKKMYEIPKSAKPKKKTGFTIEVVPPRSLEDDPFKADY